MLTSKFTLRDDYWENFELRDDDLEFLYNHLLETEIPLTPQELAVALVQDRIHREKKSVEQRRSAGGQVYLPKDHHEVGQVLIFPALGWMRGTIVEKRPGKNPDLADFQVIKVELEGGGQREFASGLSVHKLNDPQKFQEEVSLLSAEEILAEHEKAISAKIEKRLDESEEFIRIAGRWFPKALLVDINVGHLNLAEALLDMEGGGPLSTRQIMEAIELPSNLNPKLIEFSLDYALWKDERFDEVGPAGQVLWHLHRLEPSEVLNTPDFLRYTPITHDRALLSEDMLALELALDDELSPLEDHPPAEEVQLSLLYPHWRVGSLPLSARLRPLFPTAYQAPRIRFMLVDGETGEKFPGWVVREGRYVFGLREFYEKKGVLPGSYLTIRRGKIPGEVMVEAHTRRPAREWIRTVLVGADGGIVLAMLKQIVATNFDERMGISVPDINALDAIWTRIRSERVPFERSVVDTLRELAKLNPQGHVHAIELYSTLNLIRRCPPAPLFALLASRPWFVHVGDLHFRFDDSEKVEINQQLKGAAL